MTINTLDKPQAVLFDLDGTLLDTANDLGEALNYVLAKYDLPIVARENYRPVASDGAMGLLNLGFKAQLKDFDYDVLRDEFLTYYHENIAKHTCLYQGVNDLLSRLNADNIPWGIVTNKPEGLTKQLLPYFPEFKHCAVMIGGDTLSTRKPNPEPLFHACNIINVVPEKCIYVGDALRDIEAGNSAGMKTYVAQWGYIKPSDSIEQWHADFMIKTPQELYSIR
ncbi:HAD family hydrolase [Colwelliaceae bacterium 6441]